jgi:acetolactate synthase-1/2/3 large subunit
VREAYRLAEEEKPGATHIELPEDIADEHTDSTPLKRSLVRRPNADEVCRTGGDALQNAKAPVLVIGAGANRKMTGKMLRNSSKRPAFRSSPPSLAKV